MEKDADAAAGLEPAPTPEDVLPNEPGRAAGRFAASVGPETETTANYRAQGRAVAADIPWTAAGYATTDLPPDGRAQHEPLTRPAVLEEPAGAAPIPDQVSADAVELEALWDRLDDVAWECETGAWAIEVRRLARKVLASIAEGSLDASADLDRLSRLADDAEALAAGLGQDPLASKVRRVEYALRRRLDVWSQVLRLGAAAAPPADPGEPDAERLAACLDRVDSMTSTTPEGRGWVRYLALDVLRSIVRRQSALTDDQARTIARQILYRMSRVRMTDQQRLFVSTGPLAELREELRRWAVGSVDHRQVLRHIECFERTGLASDARALAEDLQRLIFSSSAEEQALGERLESHYRNANCRFVVTADLLNRLMPARDPERSWVNDSVLGVPVYGQSVNSTQVQVRMIPDPQRLRLALEVNGRVSSATSSSSGPATFYNASEAVYRGWKEMEIGTWGIRFWPAQVIVQNDIYLQNVSTGLDRIPLLGALAQGVARNQHEQNRYAASQEVAQKIEARAKQQIDAEVDARLGKLAQGLQDRVIRPLEEMGLEPTMISAETTQQRLTARVRLAALDQLGSHTPRPQAPADSLASLQLHESAINNILERLGLNGQTMTVSQLRERLAARFARPGLFQTDPDNDDVEITFADRDAVRVRCDDGHVVLTLAFAALCKDAHCWRDFQVRVFFRPELRSRSVELVRDGIIHLIGDRLNPRAQLGLRAVFNKTFSRQRTWQLTPSGMATDPRLADLEITQCVIHDGWLGLALGPKRPEATVAQRRGGIRQ